MANLPTRNNNPGDLKNPSTGQFDQFADPNAGFAALKADLQGKMTGNTKTGLGPQSTLQDLASVWAPASDNNDPVRYATNLATKLKVATTAPLASLNVDDLASAIAGNEGYQGSAPSSSSAPLSSQAFAERIKSKYPQYKDIDDTQLTQKILVKYPQYKDMVSGSSDVSDSSSNGFPSTKLQIPASIDTKDPNKGPGFFQGLQEDIQGTNPESLGTQAGNAIKGVGNFLFPIAGDAYHDIKGDSTKTALQQAGDLGSSALSAATLIPGVGEGVLGLKAGLLGAKAAEAGAEGANLASKAAPGLLSSVGKNAALGGAFGATGALGSGDTDPTKIAESTALGAGTGGLLGAGSHFLGETLGKASATPESRLTEQTARLKTLTKALNDNSRPANGMSGATNPIKTLEENKWTSLLKSPNGKVDGSALTNPQDTGVIDNEIENHSAQASDLVKSLQGTVPLDSFRKAAEDAIKSDPGIRGSLNIPKELALLDSKLASAKMSYGDELPYKAIDEIRAGMNRGYNPDEMDTKRVIGDTARQFLYNGNGTNDAIRSAMANEAELIRARNFVEKLHGTSVPGGQFGKYFADVIGAGVGTGLGNAVGGPIGGAIGTGIGGAATHKLGGILQGRYFDPIGSKTAGLLSKVAKSGAGKTIRGTAKAGLLRGSGSLVQ